MSVKKTKKKTNNSAFDSNGQWVEEKTRIKGAVRRMFRLSPQFREVMQKARVELPPLKKKDGGDGKRPQVRYRCACCGELFPQKYVQVDHINPVIQPHRDLNEMSYDEIVRAIFCDIYNLQVICSTPIKDLPKGMRSCHSKKTNEENFVRKCWIEFKKTKKGPFSEAEIREKNSEFIEKFKQKAKK